MPEGKVSWIDFHITLSRLERRESVMVALARNLNAPNFRMPVQHEERLRAWFREWREHMWRCYDAQ